MIAFVFSGGGNRGAIEAGALQALFAHSIQPNILVGSSAGALNAAFLALDPTPAGADQLAARWLSLRRQDVFRGGPLVMALRLLLGRDSLFSSHALRRLVHNQLPPGVSTFGDLPQHIQLYVTAASLNTGTLYLYGEDPSAALAEAVLASAAHPVIFEPVETAQHQLVDGGAVANVPIEIAIEKGAKTVYAIDVGYSGQARPKARNVLDIVSYTISAMMYQHLLDDLQQAAASPQVTLHHITIGGFEDTHMWDLSHTAEMIAHGRRVTQAYLANPQPVSETLRRASLTAQAVPVPKGARLYQPRRHR